MTKSFFVAFFMALLLPIEVVNAKQPAPLYPIIKAAPVVIEPDSPADKAPDKEQRALAKSLERLAAQQLKKQAVKRGLAQSIVVLETGALPGSEPAQAPLLQGTIRLPLALSKEFHGNRANFHKMPFATINLQLKQPDGSLMATKQVVLRCGDVAWTSGGRFRRLRPLSAVLGDFVKKGIESAVKEIVRDTTPPSAV